MAQWLTKVVAITAMHPELSWYVCELLESEEILGTVQYIGKEITIEPSDRVCTSFVFSPVSNSLWVS
jgi:hypothetical protein